MKCPCKEGKDWALFVVRFMLGSVFVLHGCQKVFGLFGGPGISGFAGFVNQQMGMPMFLGYAAGLFELIGGLLVLLGVLAELGAAMIVPVMLVAVFMVHWKDGYFSQNHGYEYALNLLLIAVAVILGGPGKLALWDPLKRFRDGVGETQEGSLPNEA